MKTRYELQYPIKFGDKQLSELEIERPKAKHIKDFGSGNFLASDQIKLIHLLTGLTPNQVGELDIVDFTEVGKIIASFFPKDSAN
jgi:hypothetical protein